MHLMVTVARDGKSVETSYKCPPDEFVSHARNLNEFEEGLHWLQFNSTDDNIHFFIYDPEERTSDPEVISLCQQLTEMQHKYQWGHQ